MRSVVIWPGLILSLMLGLGVGGVILSQDLPPEMRADQYLLEGQRAVEADDPAAALRAFEKLEVLPVDPPVEFFYWYGQALVEHGTTVEAVGKGADRLKQYMLNMEKGAEQYKPTLELLVLAGQKIKHIEQQRKAAEAERQHFAALPERLPSLLVTLKQQMIMVEGGTFTMGCTKEQEADCYSHEKPTHRVRVPRFEIGQYEVTQEVWEAVMGENPSRFQGCAQCPVEDVSWEDVQEFLARLNALTGEQYRLPTEAEWEYAARGGQQSRGYKYAGSDNPGRVGWSEENSSNRPYPVGRKKPNELGLYDMSGNVWEWVEDCWNGSYHGAPTDGRAWESGHCGRRVVRGGSGGVNSWYLRSADRIRNDAGKRDDGLGFRLARTLTP